MKLSLLPGLFLGVILATAQFAAAIAPTADELAQSRGWAAARFDAAKTAADFAPFFSFTYDGKPSTEFLKTWELKKSSRQLDDKRKEYTLTFTDPKTGLELRCVGVEYLDFPTVEWTLYFKNTSDKDTPILADIQALDDNFARPAQGEFVLHYAQGDTCAANAFRPFELPLTPGLEKRFAPGGGRPTNGEWPYYNLANPDGSGMFVAIGWPGQWASCFTRDGENHLRIRAGQELTHFKLLPGEEVRSPLIVLMFWKGGDLLRSQNLWRKWMVAHNTPHPGGKTPSVQFLACSSHFFEEMYKTNTEIQKFFIDRYLEEGLKLDYWWMDAGWYPCDPVGWWKTGTWEVDTRRFPKGLREVSDHAHPKDVKIIVWFEPERTHPDTWLTQNHPEWIHGGKGGGLLDLGNADAWKWLTEHINKTIDEQGIDLYRQDFNMDPLGAWRAADAADRQGITEIKHVTGYLAYWDDLIKHHPNMLIDSCASGGRRNDLETLRRAVPLLRSDYIMEPVGNQGHTYGLSYWIPFYGTGTREIDPYAIRSVLCTSFTSCFDMRRNDLDYKGIKREMDAWRQYAKNFMSDYYPLTGWNIDADKWIAWQFNTPERGEGVVQAFRRAESLYETLRVKLHDLDADAVYTLTNLDVPGTTEAKGRDLMEKGLLIPIEKSPGSAVITYKKK
jgi:alpha-galactosidase